MTTTGQALSAEDWVILARMFAVDPAYLRYVHAVHGPAPETPRAPGVLDGLIGADVTDLAAALDRVTRHPARFHSRARRRRYT